MEAQEFRTHLLKHLKYDPTGDDEDINWGMFSYSLRNAGNTITVPPVKPLVITVDVMDSYTDSDEYSSSLWVVFKVTHEDGSTQFFKKTGYYVSHEGQTWDGALVEVKPEIKTITVWNEPTDIYDDSYDSY